MRDRGALTPRWAGVVLLLAGALALSSRPGWAVQADPISPGSFSIVILPDTQNYATAFPHVFNAQTQWIADHKESHNIQMVLHVGDLVNNVTDVEFGRAKAAMSILDAAGVPYSIAIGNHDCDEKTRSSLFNDPAYFGPGSAYASQSSIGGFFEPGKTDNSYSTFSAGGRDWLVFSTEFAPRNQVVEWMDAVATAHPNHNLILNTHAYLYCQTDCRDTARYDWATYNVQQSWSPHYYWNLANVPGGVNDGQELWDKLVKKHEGWKFVFCGHVTHGGVGWLADQGDYGNAVHQILANYQEWSPWGGNGYLRIMEFLADGDTVKLSTYSPYMGAYFRPEAPLQQFTLSMGTPFSYVPYVPIWGVSAANLQVVDKTSVWTATSFGPRSFAPISPANMADVSLAMDGAAVYLNRGVLLATVRQNSRNGYFGTAEVAHVNSFGGLENAVQIATSRAGVGGEYNADLGVAFFSFDDPWIAGHVLADGTLLQGVGVAARDLAKFSAGRYRLAPPRVNSLTDGMLFAVGGENGDEYISTACAPFGYGWELAFRENAATSFGSFVNGRWSFVYVDYDTLGLVGGRVAADGSLLRGVGDFTLNRDAGAGVYRLRVPGYTPSDGMLLLTVNDLETVDGLAAPADNIISYEADGQDFVIQTRDRQGSLSPLEDVGFVFMFVAFDNTLYPFYGGESSPPMLGDANWDGRVDDLDASILAAHWQQQTGATWADADFNGDGAVDDLDASVLASRWQAGTPGSPIFLPVPEPSTIALLAAALGTLVLLRARGHLGESR